MPLFGIGRNRSATTWCKGPGKSQDKRDMKAGRGISRNVDPLTMSTIEQADRVCKTVRSWMPDGGANMKVNVLESDGVSYARLAKAREMPLGTVLERATAAKTWGGANCDEFSAMTYSMLVAEGTKGPVLRGHNSVIGGHEFTMIGDPREVGHPVVCDAWVLNPQGHTWKDNNWNHWYRGGFHADQYYNDSRPNPQYDISNIETKFLSKDEAYAMYGPPAGQSLGQFLVKSNWKLGMMNHKERSTIYNTEYRYST